MIRYQGLRASQIQPKGDLCPVGDSAASVFGTVQKQNETGFIPVKMGLPVYLDGTGHCGSSRIPMLEGLRQHASIHAK